MTKVTDIYQSEFLRAGDLQKPVRVTILDWATQEFTDQKTGKPQPRIVLQFTGAKKRLVLNPTNAHAIGNAYGDMETWPGKALILSPAASQSGRAMISVTPMPVEPTTPAADDNPFV
jgi:hypothetical protein